MNSDDSPLSAYFSGCSSPEDEQSLAQSLATDPEFADAFVEQAKLDAMLGEIYRDQRAGQMHASLTSLLSAKPSENPKPERPAKIIRGPFPYWKQVAAVLLAGLFLWAISGLWHSASQVAVVRKGQISKPRTETMIAASSNPPKHAATEEDRELESWLKGYFVDAQPSANQPLEAWLKLLVEHEFPLHNRRNKHRSLTWEIRGKDAAEQTQLSQRSLQAQCSAASLFTQIQGIAALAGCELHVETDKLVLTPMKESSDGTETREMMLAEAFVRGSGVVRSNAGVTIIREFPYPTDFDPPQIPQTFGTQLEDAQENLLNISGTFPVTPINPTAFLSKVISAENMVATLAESGIEWPAGASVGEVAMVESVNLAYQNANAYYWHFQPQMHSGQTSRLYKTTITTTPKGLRQLEILAGLTAADQSPPNLEITSHTFPTATAPNETDRVVPNEEIAPLLASWQPQATISSVSINPSPLALPALSSSGGVTTWDAQSVDLFVQQRLNLEFESSRFIIPQASTANLKFTRSGELVKISGSINEPGADAGVDLSLGLFPGQNAIVKGPVTNGTSSYYVLKLAK
jgi:hypothetical protein